MGTGNSKKSKDEEEQKDNINDIEPINVRLNKRKATNPTTSHVGLQPMRRYGRHLTATPTNITPITNTLNIDPNNEHQKKNFRKSSEKYLMQFKQQYQTGDSNILLSHLTEKVSPAPANEFSQDVIEIIREKFMPHYVFDWKLEKDEKTGKKLWKNKGKIKINEELMNEINKILKKPIGASEPFYKKRAWLFHYLTLNIDKKEQYAKLIIDKNNIFESSFKQFKEINNKKLKVPMRVVFLGEEDNDEDVVNKYWYSKIFEEIFSKERKLFRENTNESLGKNTLLFYPEYPGMNMEYYEFFGKLILKSFFDRVNIKGFNLNNIVLNPVIKRKITVEDIKYYDMNLYKILKQINDSNIKGNKDLEKYNFTWKIKDENNKIKEIELIENGKKIFLNDENKFQFIEKVIYQEAKAPYEKQIKSLNLGIFPILDENLKGIFSIDELNFLFHGQTEIDINDWKENTDYKGDYNENHKVIKMFWDKIKKLNQSELSKVLQFSTWLTNIPIDGFGDLKSFEGKIQKFTIEPFINYSSEDDSKYEFRPMEANPSFNRLILPEYPNSKEMDKAFEIILNQK